MHKLPLVLFALCILVGDERSARPSGLLAGFLRAHPEPVAIQAVPPPARAAEGSAATGAVNPIGAQASEDGAELLKRVARSMGRYARDVSEIPLTVESKVSKFDPSGKPKSSKSSSHAMQFVKRSYGEEVVTRHLDLNKPGLHRISKDEINGDSATSLLALVFDNGMVSASNQYNLVSHLISKRLEVKIVDSKSCQGFDPMQPKQRLWCGKTHLLLDMTTLDPLSASFEAGGFPKTCGDIRYLSFSFVEEFQKVSMEGSREPFLLPARIVVTYESNKGRTVVESKFSVKATKGAGEVSSGH